MMRCALSFALAGLLCAGAPPKSRKATNAPAKPAPAIATHLTKDQQAVHVLNRLAFGPRPGDIEEVRRIGAEKWIERQLHPETIPENPALEAKLLPLETIRLTPAQILAAYPQNPPGFPKPVPLNELLKQDQINKLYNGTLDERKAILNALDAGTRRRVMNLAGQQLTNVLPELKKEFEEARKAQQAENQAEIKRRMPPLDDLLDAAQRDIVRRGTPAQIAALVNQFEEPKRSQVAAAIPRQQLAGLPELRHLAAQLRQPQEVVLSDLREAKILRAVYSSHQLEEALVDFWFNHFNVFEGKQSERPLLASYERDAIRPYVFGHFKDMLLATARHPAMLVYLDNQESIAQSTFDIGPFAPRVDQVARQLAQKARGLNENYGREIMELHTLGVDGGYTQDDVVNVARCFTGWTIAKPATDPQFVFAGFIHDYGAKTVLGHTIPAGGGESDGLQVIDILARHPATARFLSKELAQRFVADNPPQALVEKMAQTFLKTDGDLRAVMAAMFASAEFWSDAAWQSKVKSPFEMVASAVRASGADALDGFVLAQRIADLGEPLYGKLEPTGYPNTGDAWLNSAGLFGRLNFASALAGGNLRGVELNAARLEGKPPEMVARELLGHEVSGETRDALTGTGKAVVALVIGSPDFQKR